VRSFNHEFRDGYVLYVDVSAFGATAKVIKWGKGFSDFIDQRMVKEDDTEDTLKLWAQSVIVKERACP
jgi:hypothetical protein